MEKKNLYIGFDIGVASVGWCVCEENGKILEYKDPKGKNRLYYGVRLFEDASEEKTGESKNLSRRKARQIRRIIRRKHQRNIDFINLCKKYKYLDNISDFYTYLSKCNDMPLLLRVNGIQGKKLTTPQIIKSLFNYLQHRGFFYDVVDNEKEEVKTNLNSILAEKNKFPSEIQYEIFCKEKKYIGNPNNQLFSNKRWIEEIKIFCDKQNIEKNFTKEFIEIFSRIRDFSTGPGGEKQPTPYGLYRINKNKIEKIGDNLWDVTIGKCSIYPDENRSIKKSCSAELFNLLNDLQNLRIIDEAKNKTFITKQQKNKILNDLIHENLIKTANVTPNRILKSLGIKDPNRVTGWRINKQKKQIVEEMSNTLAFIRLLKLTNFSFFDNNYIDLINKIIEQKSKNKNWESLIKNVEQIINQSTINNFDLINLRELLEKITGYSSTHAFSIKALDQFNKLLFENEHGDNQQNIRLNYFDKGTKSNAIITKYINPNIVMNENEITSPSAKRAIRQTYKIFNKLVKFLSKDFTIKQIAVEMARESNTKEARENIQNFQKINEQRNKEIEDSLSDIKQPLSLSSRNKSIVKYKLWLAKQQNWCDIYTHNPINRIDIIKNPELFNIDHIIPYSISLDDSSNNKVLTTMIINKEKANLTPYQYFKKNNKLDKYADLTNWWKDLFNTKENDRKFKNLIFCGDPKEELQDFLSRNLQDTRVATSCVLNTFTKYAQGHDMNLPISINGRITNYVRKCITSVVPPKNRDFYRHHADDAFALAFLSSDKNNLKIFRWLANKKLDPSLDDDISKNIEYLTKDFLIKINTIYPNKNYLIENPPKFSKMILKNKDNIQFFNDTLYSGKYINEKLFKIQKIDLLDSSLKDLSAFFGDNPKRKNDLLIVKSNPKIYEILNKIYINPLYSDPKISPFKKFFDESSENKTGSCLLIRLEKNKIFNIRKLKYMSSKIQKFVKNNKVVPSKKKLSFNDSINWTHAYIYLKNNKYFVKAFSPIIDSSKSFKEDVEKIKIFKNSIFLQKSTNDIFYLNAIEDTNNMLILKPIACSSKNENIYSKLYKNYKKSGKYTPKQIIDEFEIISIDELGNIYK